MTRIMSTFSALQAYFIPNPLLALLARPSGSCLLRGLNLKPVQTPTAYFDSLKMQADVSALIEMSQCKGLQTLCPA